MMIQNELLCSTKMIILRVSQKIVLAGDVSLFFNYYHIFHFPYDNGRIHMDQKCRTPEKMNISFHFSNYSNYLVARFSVYRNGSLKVTWFLLGTYFDRKRSLVNKKNYFGNCRPLFGSYFDFVVISIGRYDFCDDFSIHIAG